MDIIFAPLLVDLNMSTWEFENQVSEALDQIQKATPDKSPLEKKKYADEHLPKLLGDTTCAAFQVWKILQQVRQTQRQEGSKITALDEPQMIKNLVPLLSSFADEAKVRKSIRQTRLGISLLLAAEHKKLLALDNLVISMAESNDSCPDTIIDHIVHLSEDVVPVKILLKHPSFALPVSNALLRKIILDPNPDEDW